MDDQNPQPAGPGIGPGMQAQVPQAAPAADRGPDSHHMPTMSEQLDRQSPDYEGRYKGLNKWITDEFNTLRGTVEQMGRQMTQLVDTLKPQPQAPKAPAPVSAGKAAPGPDVLDLAIQTKKAQQYRDMLIDEYEKATGLPLAQFRKHIEVVAPGLKDDGSLDDSGQRAVIEDFVNNLKGLKGNAQKEVLQGHMPGSAPSAPQGPDNLVKELHDIMRVMGDPDAWKDLSATDQATTETRYFELLAMPEVQEQHQGNLQPSMSISDLSSKVRELTRTVAGLRGKLPASFA